MSTIQIEVPQTIALSGVRGWTWDVRLQTLWQYKQDQDDIGLVQQEQKKSQSGVSLQSYLSKYEDEEFCVRVMGSVCMFGLLR